MKFTKISLSLPLLIFCCSVEANGQKINQEALDGFWRVVDRMKADQPLTDSLWNAYYQLYGNRVYVKNNLGEQAAAIHRGYLELVFRPSYADSLKKVAPGKNEDLREYLFQNLWYIKQHESAVRAYGSVVTAPGYLPLALDLARKYLPENVCNPVPDNLSIYLEAFASDGAVQDSSMYFGIAIVYGYDQYRKTAIPAHEFSHILRKQKTVTGRMSSGDSALFTVVDEINNEGCADLIDKTVLEAHADSIIRGRAGIRKFLSTAESTLRELDTAMAAGEPGGPGTTSPDRFNEIIRYSSGHIPGFFMVRVIRRNGLVSELIKSCDNPFRFFYLYQQAAITDKEKPPVFSKRTMAGLHRVERAAYR